MKQLVGMVVVFLALSTLALADNSVDFTNRGGTRNGSSAGLNLTGSELIAVDGLNGTALTTGNLGSVTFSAGSLKSGSLQTGALSMLAAASSSPAMEPTASRPQSFSTALSAVR